MFLHTTVQMGSIHPQIQAVVEHKTQTLTLNGSQIAISGGNNIDIGPLLNNDYNNLANKPTIPADVSDLTDTSNLFRRWFSIIIVKRNAVNNFRSKYS